MLFKFYNSLSPSSKFSLIFLSIVSIALSNFYLVFFTIFLKLKVFLLCVPTGICGHSQIPARMTDDCSVRTPNLINMPLCTVTFTDVSYKCQRHKRQSERVHARFWVHLSGETLTSISTDIYYINLDTKLAIKCVQKFVISSCICAHL